MRAVAQVFAFGGHAEDVAGEQLGDEALVIVVDLFGAVEPADGLRTGVLASTSTSGKPLTNRTRSARRSADPARKVYWVVAMYWFWSRSS